MVDIAKSIQSGLQLRGAFGQLKDLEQQRERLGEQRQQEQARQEQLGSLRGQSLGLGGETQPQQQQARLQLLSESPEEAKKFFEAFSKLPTAQQDKTRESSKRVSVAAASALNSPDGQLKEAVAAQAQQLADSEFFAAAKKVQKLAQLAPEQLRQQLTAISSQGRDVEKIIAEGERKQKRLAEQGTKGLDEDIKASKTAFEQIDKLRSKVDATSKQFKLVRDASVRVNAVLDVDESTIQEFAKRAGANNPGHIEKFKGNVEAFGDLALIFNFMKMLDPGSTVREGEFATAQNTGGIPDRITNLYEKVLSGSRLNDSQRRAIQAQASTLFKDAKKQNTKDLVKFRRSAKAFDLDEAQIFDDPVAQAQPAQPAQAAQAAQAAQQVGRFSIEVVD